MVTDLRSITGSLTRLSTLGPGGYWHNSGRLKKRPRSRRAAACAVFSNRSPVIARARSDPRTLGPGNC